MYLLNKMKISTVEHARNEKIYDDDVVDAANIAIAI
jgi:hypothetical protein